MVLKFIIVCLVRFFEYRCVRMPQYAVDENMTVVEVEVEGELAPVFIMPTPLRINHTYSMVSRTTTTRSKTLDLETVRLVLKCSPAR